METFLMYFLFAVGLVLIIKGGDFFVDAAVWFAEVSGIPHFIVGATIVGFATSLPEIIVSVIAASQGDVEMATGNAVGSVTANTGLILGISLLFMPMAIRLKEYFPKIMILLGSIAVVWIFGMSGSISLIALLVLVALFAVFVWENVKGAKRNLASSGEEAVEEKEVVTKALVAKKIALFVFGCAGIIVGSELLVNYGSAIAASLGVPTRIISISAVAIGTSLPELVTTVSAISKKQASLSVGNILGSNIIDITFILPPCMLAYGKNLPVSAGTLYVDLPVLFGLSVMCFVPTFFTKKFSRWQGVALLLGYVAYIAYTFIYH
ncbi:MAG: calcium/sodium antiporter [Ruminococcus sp.]|jgi:cation:H+ antiporter|nr:calcium/sodium antiporter [Ruminococcus sp.]